MSLQVTKTISLDFRNNKQVIVPSIQYDNNVTTLIINITDNGVFYPIDKEKYKVIYKCSKPDNTFVVDMATILDNGSISMGITGQMITASGSVGVQLTVMDLESDIIRHTMIFKIYVEKAVCSEDQITSSSEYHCFEQDIINYVKEARDAADKSSSVAVEEAAVKFKEAIKEDLDASRTHMQNAKTSEENAKAYASNAKLSETNAKSSETNSLTSEKNAKVSETNTKSYELSALDSKEKASVSEINSKESEKNAIAASNTSTDNLTQIQGIKKEIDTISDEMTSNTLEVRELASNTRAYAESVSETKEHVDTKVTEINSAAENVVTNKDLAEQAALSSASSEKNALLYKNDAKVSEDNTKASENNVIELEKKVNSYKITAENSANTATEKANELTKYSNMSKSYAIGTDGEYREDDNVDNAKYYQSLASGYASDAENSKISAKESEDNASTYSSNAGISETNAHDSEVKAKTSENNAKVSETNAKQSETNAKTSEINSSISESNAKTYMDTIAGTEQRVEALGNLAKSYVVGTNNTVRDNDSVDNAKYYYEQAKSISQSLSGALKPMGTISFEELPKDANPGDMYNISNEFIADNRFKDGSGGRMPVGTNIYFTDDGYWDCLAGTTVTGVKGSNETSYRQGNIIITPDNLGLSTVSTTGSYNDLSDKPTIATLGGDDAAHRLVTDTEKANWTSKGTYSKPSDGIPKSDLSSDVQTSLEKANTAIQSHQDISGKQDKSTAVTHTANTAVGSVTKPVYINKDGIATATTYSLGKSVPSDAKFTDTNTWRPLGTTADTACAGNDSRLSNARPASDVSAWAKESTKPSYSWSEIESKPSSFAPSAHNHTKSQITDFPSSLPANGGTSSYTNYVNANNIAEKTNLNSITTPGLYYSPANSTVATFTNCPTKNAFFMIVGKHAGVYQELTEYMTSGQKKWMRNYYNNVWGSWIELVYSDATTSVSGLMSAAMVTKLNGIATGANNYTLPTASSTLGGVKTTSTVTSTTGLTACPIISGVPYYKDTNTTYRVATTSANGLMSSSDKTKLDGIATGANKTSIANNLTTTTAGYALDARQGKALNDKITTLNNDLVNKIKIVDKKISVNVSYNTVVDTTIPYSSYGIDISKVISTTVTWSNQLNDIPSTMLYYNLPIDLITHSWSQTQTVNFNIRIAYFE